MKKATIKEDGYEIFAGFRIRVINPPSGKRYQVDLGKKSGKHVRKSYKILQDARNFAQTKSVEADNKGIAALKFTDAQKSDANEALHLLKEYGINLRTAAQYYIKQNQKVDHTNGIGALIDQHLKAKANLRPRAYLETQTHLNPFKADLGARAIGSIEPSDVDVWLDQKGFMPTSRANHRRYLSIFFNWAVDNEKIQSNPVKKTRKIKKEHHTPKIYTANEVATLIEKAEQHHPHLAPYLAIAFFGGIRPQEILRLSWTDIDMTHKEIHIQAGQAKTSTARIVHISDNLLKWLAKYRQQDGPIFSYSPDTLKRWRQNIHKKACIKSIQDGARHSFATYHLALNSIDDTLQELGHVDTKMLFKHYRGLAKNRKAQAKQFFNILPEDTTKDKVIPFKTAKSA